MGESEGNGNEHRGSFHGTPRGYAQLIDSPEKWLQQLAKERKGRSADVLCVRGMLVHVEGVVGCGIVRRAPRRDVGGHHRFVKTVEIVDVVERHNFVVGEEVIASREFGGRRLPLRGRTLLLQIVDLQGEVGIEEAILLYPFDKRL